MLYGLSNHFYSENDKIYGNLCLLTMDMREAIVANLQGQVRAGCRYFQSIFLYLLALLGYKLKF